jgi:hypothetical protein
VTSTGLLFSQLKVFGPFDAQLLLGFTLFALQPQHNLTGRLGLFVKHGLGLTTVTHLFGIVPALALRKVARLTRLVLCHLVQRVLFAFACAVGVALFGEIHHGGVSISDGRTENEAVRLSVFRWTVAATAIFAYLEAATLSRAVACHKRLGRSTSYGLRGTPTHE